MSNKFCAFQAARILNGFFSTVAQGVSSITIDMRSLRAELLKIISAGWPHVHQGSLFLPRTCAKNQYLV